MELIDSSLPDQKSEERRDCIEDIGDIGALLSDNERMSASIGTKESIWQDWLDRNSRRHRRLTADLQDEMPGVLGALIPALNGDVANIGIWSFYLDCITDFLIGLPAYHEDNEFTDCGVGYSAEADCVPWDEMYLYFSALLAALYDGELQENKAMWKACAVLEQLDLWPRSAREWMVWLSRLGRFVQTRQERDNFLQVLGYLEELTEDKSIPHFTEAAQAELLVVLQVIRRFVGKCAWSYA